MKPIRVPRELDSHPRFLLWRADLVFVWLTVTAMGSRSGMALIMNSTNQI